jgi:hypothetical protein
MCPIFNFFRRRKSSGFPIGELISASAPAPPIRHEVPPKRQRRRGEYVKLDVKSYYNLHVGVVVDGFDGYLTLERIGKGFYLRVRNGKRGRVLLYVRKRLVGQLVELLAQGADETAKDIVCNLLYGKFSDMVVKWYGKTHKPWIWAVGFGIWIKAHKKGRERGATGVLIAKKKRLEQGFYYYVAERVKGTRRKYKHYYLTRAPWEHLIYAFDRPERLEGYRPIINYLESRGIEVYNYGMVIKKKLIPNWLVRKRVEERLRAGREDEGIIGEAQEEAESWGWDEVLMGYREAGDEEAVREVEEWLGESESE